MGARPTTMPVAVYRTKGSVDIEERAVPRPGDGQVLVEISHCGVCGSDLHMIMEGWGTPGTVEGHEWSGVVVEVGADVDEWRPGDAVVGGPSPRCGECRRCRDGRPAQCERRGRSVTEAPDGAFAAYHLAEARSLRAIPDGLPPRAAALAEPLAVALHGISRSGIGEGDRALVLGAGPIGALTLAVLVDRGIGPVDVVEPADHRAELARALGARDVRRPDDLTTFPMWEPESLAEPRYDVVFECSGRRSAMEAGFHQLARGGHLVLLGAGIEPPSFDPNRFILNELQVSGSFVYDTDGFEQALALLASGRLRTDLLIDPHDVPLLRMNDALRGLVDGRIAGKAMIVPGAPATDEGTP